MPQYAYFQGFPGNRMSNGKNWISLDGFEFHIRVFGGRLPGNAGDLDDVTLFVHGMTAATFFADAVLTGKVIARAEIELTQVVGGKELQCLLYRMRNVTIGSVTRTVPPYSTTLGQQVEVVYEHINKTYTPIPTQPPIRSEQLRLWRA